MPKLWGSPSPAPAPSSTRPSDDPSHPNNLPGLETGVDADERTALLSSGSPAPNPHAVDPDDPAVTPYNRLSVRSMRWATIGLLVLALGWWLVLLVNVFVTVPGLFMRSGGWGAFGFSTLSVLLLLVLLLFYATPSRSERLILTTISFFLFICSLLILLSPLRRNESWPGILSVFLALFTSIWAIITDSIVEHGKAEEEERLTGRAETRKSLKEWCSIFFGSGLFAVFLVASVLMMSNLAIEVRDYTLKQPGDMVMIGSGNSGYRLHLYCSPSQADDIAYADRNKTTTTVLIETGSAPALTRMESWIKQTPYRYCYYDRPGFGFSDAAPSPLSAGMVIDALSEALVHRNETGPWVLAANSVGGIYARIFAARHQAEVKGLLLVDTLPESLLGRIGNPGRGFALWLRGVISPLGLQQLWGAVILRRGREDRVYGREAGCGGKALMARLQEALAVRWSQNELEAANGILDGRMRMAVVSSGDRMKRDQGWAQGQRELAGMGKGPWDVVDGVGSEVWRSEEGVRVLEKRLGEMMR
ncbi:hypothetical protein BZA77DRAFT_376954 [Pyronema omphalodes]|nr:hypothetical protein BZA77DRAFT_376954 [Pyronema omphalodes]